MRRNRRDSGSAVEEANVSARERVPKHGWVRTVDAVVTLSKPGGSIVRHGATDYGTQDARNEGTDRDQAGCRR